MYLIIQERQSSFSSSSFHNTILELTSTLNLWKRKFPNVHCNQKGTVPLFWHRQYAIHKTVGARWDACLSISSNCGFLITVYQKYLINLHPFAFAWFSPLLAEYFGYEWKWKSQTTTLMSFNIFSFLAGFQQNQRGERWLVEEGSASPRRSYWAQFWTEWEWQSPNTSWSDSCISFCCNCTLQWGPQGCHKP